MPKLRINSSLTCKINNHTDVKIKIGALWIIFHLNLQFLVLKSPNPDQTAEQAPEKDVDEIAFKQNLVSNGLYYTTGKYPRKKKSKEEKWLKTLWTNRFSDRGRNLY
jgi:hypothetical protein